jgi:hypothetical protein
MRNELFTREIRETEKGFTYIISPSGACTLILPDRSVRSIGKLVKNGNLIEYYNIRKYRGHLHIKSNSYAITEFIWREIKPDIIIIDVSDLGKRLSISYSDSDQVKQYLTFKDQGFETQIFIPVESMDEIGRSNQIVRPGVIKISPPEPPKKPTVENFSLF